MTDLDSGSNGAITYAIVNGNNGNFFDIDGIGNKTFVKTPPSHLIQVINRFYFT